MAPHGKQASGTRHPLFDLFQQCHLDVQITHPPECPSDVPYRAAKLVAHARLGERDKAHQWYDRAVQWMDKNQPKNEELRRFRVEAAELLELNEKK